MAKPKNSQPCSPSSRRWKTNPGRREGMRGQPKGRPRTRRDLPRWIRAMSKRLTRQYWRKEVREVVCLGVSSCWRAANGGRSLHEDEKCLAQGTRRLPILASVWSGRPQPVLHRVSTSQRRHVAVAVLSAHNVRGVVVAALATFGHWCLG